MSAIAALAAANKEGREKTRTESGEGITREASKGAKHGLAILKVTAKVTGKMEVNRKRRLGMDGKERASVEVESD